jgi:hypothetical protein
MDEEQVVIAKILRLAALAQDDSVFQRAKKEPACAGSS